MACMRCTNGLLEGADRLVLGMAAGGGGAARPALLDFLPLNPAEAVRFLLIFSTNDPKENVIVSSSPAQMQHHLIISLGHIKPFLPTVECQVIPSSFGKEYLRKKY